MNDKVINNAMVSIEYRVKEVYNQGYYDGYEEGKSEAKLIETIDNMNRQYRSGYSKGLEEAWECARKLLYDDSLSRDILTELGADTFCGVIQNCSASEAIAKLKEYEEQKKQSEKSCKDCKHSNNGMPDFKSERCEACYYDERLGGNCLFEQKPTEKSCDNCRFVDLMAHEFPCSVCSASHTFRWEPRKEQANG